MKYNTLNYFVKRGSYLSLMVMLFAGCACSETNKSNSEPNGKEENKTETAHDVSVLTTSADRSRELVRNSLEFSKRDNMSPSTITLKPSETFQTMDGFGTAITGSTCHNLLKMAPEDRAKFLKETFHPTEGVGFGYVRISIGCSDFSLQEFTCCDTPGLENFALSSEDKEMIIPVLKEILTYAPDLKIIGSPWTCPKWMKVKDLKSLTPYDSWTSGHLNPKYYEDYGNYFVKWIQAYEAAGIPIYAITPQNEPLNRGNSASLFMGWDEQREFIKRGLGPAMTNAGLKTKIYAFDHNYNYDNMESQRGYVTKIYEDPDASKYLTGAAYHNYGGNKDELLKVHNAAPRKELIFTETSIGEWNDGRNLSTRLCEDMREVALGTVNNFCKAVIVWNLMLDSEKGPNRPGGCQTCYGAVDISSRDYKTLTRNSHYFIIAHLSSVVRPGAVRIGTDGFTAQGLVYAAFKNTDGTYAFVACNDAAEERSMTLSDGTHHFTAKVPPHSVASFSWK